MRRFALLLLATVLFSCATTEEEPGGDAVVIEERAPTAESQQPAESVPAQDAESAPATPTGEEPAAEPAAEAESESPEETPAPQLRIIEPSDLSAIASRELTVSIAIEPEGSAVPVSLEVRLVGGPVVTTGFEITDASDLPVVQMSRTIPLGGDPPSVSVTLPGGLVDGATYRWSARGVLGDGTNTGWTDPIETTADFGLAPPELVNQPPTIDRTPVISWRTDESFSLYRVTLLGPGGGTLGEVVTAGDAYEVPQPLAPGSYRVTVSGLRQNGIATREASPVFLRVLDDASPVPVWPTGGEQALGAAVGLQWLPVPGAARYQPRYRASGGDWMDLPESGQTSVPIPDALDGTQTYEWQVRALDESGRAYSYSTSESFVPGTLALRFVPVIGSGETATFTRGYASGSRDESPVSEISLTRPYEMARTPLRNGEVARIVNYALERGYVVADESGVRMPGENGEPLLGLGVMDYGHQFGLTFSDGRIVARAGRENQPAVGITWAGAVQLANLLSFVEGRPPAYDLDSRTWNTQSTGYRLPTEAEWEYAARGNTTRLLPWGTSLSGRVANYYRSFDPYEDVNEPFDGAGGPTTPADFFDGAVHDGFQTTSGASPFGVLDMVGNTWDWCWDRYSPDYYSGSDTTDPSGPKASELEVGDQTVVLAVTLDPNQRVVRGTAWNSRAPDVRLTNRGRYTELGRSYSIGVRLVRTP